jgi:hypothetical protein
MNMSSTGATSGGDAWNRFMQIAQDARTRNNGLSNVQKKSVTETSFPALSNYKPSGTVKSSFSSGTPDVKRRILGGQFDTYA